MWFGNSKNTENCIVCDKVLKHTVAFFEDDSFDLEITEEHLIELEKTFGVEEIHNFEPKNKKNLRNR